MTPCPECHAVDGHHLGCSQNGERFNAVTFTTRITQTEHRRRMASELPLTTCALPIALTASLTLSLTSIGQAAQDIFAGLWMHELGHFFAAIACGHLAVPFPYSTPISPTRWTSVTVLSLLAGAWCAWRGHQQHRTGLRIIGMAALSVALVGRSVSAGTAHCIIALAGHLGTLVLGAALACTFFVAPGTLLHRGMLRFGVLGLGASAWAMTTVRWARVSPDFLIHPLAQQLNRDADFVELLEVCQFRPLTLVWFYRLASIVTLFAMGACWHWARSKLLAEGADLGPSREVDR